jgi:hypothetical protein
MRVALYNNYVDSKIKSSVTLHDGMFHGGSDDSTEISFHALASSAGLPRYNSYSY